jgi:methionyl-tRNA formyltransferase
VRLLFAGTPEVAVPSLEALLASGHEVVAVLTRPDAPVGRGRRLTPSPVAAVARAAGVETLTPSRPRDPAFLSRLAEIAPDCCPVVAYGGLIPAEALDVPRYGWVNLHFSVLPAWRGAAPVQHAVLAGDEITGATTFRLEEALDTGPVYGVVTEVIGRHDTSGALLARLARVGAGLLVRTIEGIEAGELVPVPQPDEGVSYAPKITVEDARIDWTTPGMRVDRLARACSPAPGAWTTFRGERVKVGPVTPEPGGQVLGANGELRPGQLHVHRDCVRVGTATYPVRLGEVQPAGRRAMDAREWARGVRPEPGEGLV